MPKTIPRSPSQHLRAAWPLAALALIAALAGCSHLSEAPTHSASIAGQWVLDPASSDDFDALLKRAVEAQDAKMRKHLRPPSYSDREVPPLGMLPPEDPEQVRNRLTEQLRPADTLKLEWQEGTLEVSGNGEPARGFYPGNSASRIDVEGAGKITAGWNGDQFVIQTNYGGGEQRAQSYSVDGASGKLVVTLEIKSDALNRLEVTSRYRRSN